MLNQEQFKQDIKAAFIEASVSNADEDKALDVFVERLSGVLIKHIKTLEVVYSGGLLATNGTVTGTFNHTLK